jgi:hypothetical protein
MKCQSTENGEPTRYDETEKVWNSGTYWSGCGSGSPVTATFDQFVVAVTKINEKNNEVSKPNGTDSTWDIWIADTGYVHNNRQLFPL